MAVGFARNRLAVVGLAIVLLLVLTALLAPLLAHQSPTDQDLTLRLQPPGDAWTFGTDELGRDIYSRIVYGARITLGIVALIIVLVGPVGLFVGCAAGYVGSWLDTLLMRTTDIFLAFPRLILALAFVAAIGPGIKNAVIAIALTAWPPYARVARAETLALRETDFVSAARLQGAGAWRIILHQIVPLCLSSVIVRLTLDMSGIIITAAYFGSSRRIDRPVQDFPEPDSPTMPSFSRPTLRSRLRTDSIGPRRPGKRTHRSSISSKAMALIAAWGRARRATRRRAD